MPIYAKRSDIQKAYKQDAENPFPHQSQSADNKQQVETWTCDTKSQVNAL